jgi:hypothetical protein
MREDFNIQKWGFGMAPLKPKTEYTYKKASNTIYQILTLKRSPEDKKIENIVEDISNFKGMVNRCVRQDQWDWFTVYTRFGEPNTGKLRFIPGLLTDLRKSILSEDSDLFGDSIHSLIQLKTMDLCEFFLNRRNQIDVDNISGGYIYILSRKEEREILKIGMTTRNVEQRVKEINSATGVLFPYSARGIFKVKNPEEAERMVFEALDQFRIRKDREFFKMDFNDAMRIIRAVLINKDLLF